LIDPAGAFVTGSIQNGSSRLLISQDFLPQGDTTGRFRGTLRNKCFSRASDTTPVPRAGTNWLISGFRSRCRIVLKFTAGTAPPDWARRRAHQLRIEPLCRLCLEAGRVTPATVADHIVPHRGDFTAFRLGELAAYAPTATPGSTPTMPRASRFARTARLPIRAIRGTPGS
jgi:hypothetical protein